MSKSNYNKLLAHSMFNGPLNTQNKPTKLKIAIILGPYCVGSRPLDFDNIWDSNRGLTGTDLAAVMICSELAERHDVHLFTVHTSASNPVWEGVKVHRIEDMSIIDDSFDCVVAINEPNMLMDLKSTKPFRICWQFLNDFGPWYCKPGYEAYVDKFLGVCQKHVDHLMGITPEAKNWGVLGLGCFPDWYQDQRVPGRVVWCSSADRGLHWLLQEWPKIKKAVPEATLKIFYHFNFNGLDTIEPNQHEQNHLVEIGQRIRYIKEAIARLKDLGVEHVGSISRNQMKKELNEASVLGFSCDTAIFSEGFSVATLEAHASFTVPVITDKDCLGDVYKDSGALIVESPLSKNAGRYSDMVIKALTDKEFANNAVKKCREFAFQNTWGSVAQKLEDIIKEGRK